MQAIANAGVIDERKVARAAGAPRARPSGRLQGESAALEDRARRDSPPAACRPSRCGCIVEREREIRAFKPVEYWSIEALLEKDGQRFTAQLHQVNGKKTELVRTSATRCDSSTRLEIAQDVRGHRRSTPRAPQESAGAVHDEHAAAGSARRSSASARKRTMRVAQDLYEGIELGAEGAVGLITYMRTDSTRIAEVAAQQARDYLTTDSSARIFSRRVRSSTARRGRRTRRTRTRPCVPRIPTRRPEHVQKYLTQISSSSTS